MRKFILSMVLLLMCVVFTSNAQNMKYEYTTGTTAFTPITGASGFTLLGTTPLDDGYSAPVAIGFQFSYAGATYDSFQVSTNGFIRLGEGLTNATASNALAGTLRRIIAPLWDDLSVADSASLTYVLTGSAPNRVLTVEWRNVKWIYSATTANAEFQLKLYENGNKIEFLYGNFGTVATTVTASIGLSDNSTIGTANRATGTFLSLNIGGVATTRTFYATMGLEFAAVNQAPDANTVVTFTTGASPMTGTYTVGGASPSFKTPSEAAMALNARGVSAPVTINIRPGEYEDVLHLTTISGASHANRVTITKESGDVTLSPRYGARTAATVLAGDGIVRLDGASFVTLDGLRLVDNALNTTTALKYEFGVCISNAEVSPAITAGSRYNEFKNLFIDLNAQTVANINAIGIRLGTTVSSSVVDTALTNSFNTFQDLTIERFWRAAIQMYGFSGVRADYGNKITAVSGRNAFRNVAVTSSGSDIRAIEANAQFDLYVDKTDVYDLVVNSTGWTTNVVSAFRYNPANSTTDFNGGNLVIKDVKIYNLEIQQTQATTASVVGIEVIRLNNGSTVTVNNVQIYDLYTNGSTTSLARGIVFNGGAGTGFTTTANVYNNLIYDIRAPRSTGAPSIRAYDIQNAVGGTFNANVYYNTAYLDNSVAPTAGTHQSSIVYLANYGTSSLDLRNNIFVNTMNAGTRAVVIYASANSNLLRLASTTNNNLYFAGTPGATRLIGYDGASSFQTIETYKAAVATGGLGGPREVLSVTENPPFVSAVSPYNLNLQTTVGTQAESGGQPIAGITTDIAGTSRNANFPDIGAYEFAGIAIDNNPPSIAYTALTNTHFTSNRQLVAVINDPSGVASGANSPRLYYRKSVNDPYIVDSAPAVNGTNYTFTFNYSLLPGGSVSTGDTLFYYVAAQDANGIAVTNPSGGSGATPPGTTPPALPRTYLILGSPLNGVYTISSATFNRALNKNIEARILERESTNISPVALLESGLVDKNGNPIEQNIVENNVEQYEVLFEGNAPYRGSRSLNQTAVENAKSLGLIESNVESVYPSLSAAVTDLNLRGVSGHVTFLLADTLYTTPTLQVSITYDSVTAENRTVTFKPAQGVTTKVTANSTSPVFVVGNSYVTIDGSNMSNGTTRDLTIENTNGGASAGVAFFSNSAYSTVKNIVGVALNSTWGYGIVFSGSTYGKILNNEIKRTTLGIQLQSFSNYSEVKGNLVGSNVDADKIQNIGIAVLSTTNFDVNNNVISGLLRTATSSTAGIVLGIVAAGDDLKDGNINNNLIKDIKHTGAGLSAYAAYGIRLSGNTAITNSNIKVFNNIITDVRSDGDAGTQYNPVGIYASQGAGYQIYFNSINLYGGINYAGTSAAASAALMVNSAAVVNLDIRNNILQNSQTFAPAATLGKTYAFYSIGANTSFSDINYNDYYSIGANAGFNFLGTTAYANLADWRVATTKDANSKDVNPQYTDTLNLRPLLGSGVLFVGTPIAGITTDYLGSTRTNTPSMGAYEFPIGNIGWANLQWPGSATINLGGSVTVYGQIWVDGITNSPGAGFGIKAWVGYSSDNTNPNTWTNWVQSTYNVDVGNNDEYQANIGATLAPGTYYYATRYQLFDGAYYYGGFSGGEWNGTTNVSGQLTVQPPMVLDWQRSAAGANLPAWFSTANNERGLGWGMVNVPSTEGVAGRVIVPSRNGGTFVKLLNDSTGADAGELDVTGVSLGTFVVNDADVDHLGRIYVGNMVSTAAAVPFKVYRWDNTASVPKLVLSYLGDAVRLGDNFTVAYDAATQGYAVWAASATTGQAKVYKWTQIPGLDSLNQVPTVITLSDAVAGGIASASVGPLPNGDFYWNSNGQNARKYLANGTLVGTIPGTVVATGSGSIKFLGTQGTSEYFVTFQYGAGNQNARIVEVPNGDPTAAITYGVTTPLGANANANGTGDVAVKHNHDGSKTVFVLATNNGVGSYKSTQVIPVEFATFSAEVQNRNVMLLWKTSTETNSASFEVERTLSSAVSWSTVGSVRASGTTTETKSYSFVDRDLVSAKYQYRLKQIDLDGTYSYSNVIEIEVGLPVSFDMSQNYPNPFNPTTRIAYQIPADSRVTMELYDITGQKVATLVNTELTAGYYTFDLSVGSYGLASGVYIYRMTAVEKTSGKNFVNTKKMMMLK